MSSAEDAHKVKVVHASSVHPPNDVRVFVKECRSLAAAGYSVTYVVPGADAETIDGVRIKPVPKVQGRLRRMTQTVRAVYRAAAEERADIYQFHDPELLPAMAVLKLRQPSAKVIYDTHEDMPGSIEAKHWIPERLRVPAAMMVRAAERLAVRLLDGVVAATPAIARNFPPAKTAVVQNFPMLDGFPEIDREPRTDGPITLIHTGRVSSNRGGRELIEAMELIEPPDGRPVELVIAGMFVPESYEAELQALPGWSRVRFVGWKSREEMRELLRRADVGIALMHPEKNYVEAQPNKLFEYMAVGLPVVASDFPWWRKLVEEAEAGMLVNPGRPREIASALQRVIDHPEEAAAMGKNGRRAVHESTNWENEARNLIGYYESLTRRNE